MSTSAARLQLDAQAVQRLRVHTVISRDHAGGKRVTFSEMLNILIDLAERHPEEFAGLVAQTKAPASTTSHTPVGATLERGPVG